MHKLGKKTDKSRDQEKSLSWSKLQEIFLNTRNLDKSSGAPPVNNLCMPDVYNKLDACVQERTKVYNSLLDMRLQVQERTLEKYRRQAEQVYQREEEKLRNEFTGIRSRLPSIHEYNQTQTFKPLKKLQKRKKKRELIGYTTVPREIKGISAEKHEHPFCHRFRNHHLSTMKIMYSKDKLQTNSDRLDTGEGTSISSREFNSVLFLSQPPDANGNCETNVLQSAKSDSRLENNVKDDDHDDAMTV